MPEIAMIFVKMSERQGTDARTRQIRALKKPAGVDDPAFFAMLSRAFAGQART
jgi:hypothetical protein